MKIFMKVLKFLGLLSILLSTATLSAKEVLMAFSQDIPPYIFQKYNKGIEIDIISTALAYKGHTLTPLYFPLGRIPIAFRQKLVDAAMGDMGVDLTLSGGFYANPAVVYDNIFISLAQNNFSIHHPSDLDYLTILSFQGAEKRYPKWLNKAHKEQRFFGISNQLTQVKLLYLNRYDVVLSDRYIFKYFVKQLKLVNGIKSFKISEHKFIDVNPDDYRPVFRDKKIRDDFNFGLQKMTEKGEIQDIYDSYLE